MLHFFLSYGFGYGLRLKAEVFQGRTFGYGRRWKLCLRSNTALYNIFVFIVKIDSRWRRGGKIGVKWMVLFFWPWSDRIPRVEWHLLPNITAVNKLLWECPKKGVCKLKIAPLPTFQLFIFCRWMLKTITKAVGTFFSQKYLFPDNFC